uniref:Uncharacterized protein n=1 Tax=Anopheles quadriannulatus TaxID=34691 RepID=A0A182WZY0_ANOQN
MMPVILIIEFRIFLPLMKVVEVEVRLTGPPPPMVYSDTELMPPRGAPLKKSSIRLKLISGVMNGDEMTFCGCECR